MTGAEMAMLQQLLGSSGGSGKPSIANPIVSIGGTVMSLVEANKQAAAKQEAEKAAAKAAAAAEEKLSQDFFASLDLPMEQYYRALRNITALNAQGIEGVKEGDFRNIAPLVGRAGMVGKEAVLDVTDRAANDLYKLDMMKAQAAQSVAQNLGEFEMQRAKSAQLAAMAAEKARVAAMQQAFNQGAQAVVGTEQLLNPTYSRKSDKTNKSEKTAQASNTNLSQQTPKLSQQTPNILSGLDYSDMYGDPSLMDQYGFPTPNYYNPNLAAFGYRQPAYSSGLSMSDIYGWPTD